VTDRVSSSERHEGSTTRCVRVEHEEFIVERPVGESSRSVVGAHDARLGAEVVERVPDPGSRHGGEPPTLYLTTTERGAPHPYSFSRSEWETFKRLGDLAWAEWDKRMGTR